jgi:hypothetical protein
MLLKKAVLARSISASALGAPALRLVRLGVGDAVRQWPASQAAEVAVAPSSGGAG